MAKAATVDEYIAALPADLRAPAQRVRIADWLRQARELTLSGG